MLVKSAVPCGLSYDLARLSAANDPPKDKVIMEILGDILYPGVPIFEKILRPILVYVFLIVLLKFAGQRTLSQMNPFDLVVLLMLSNTVQNAIIGNDNSVFGGMIGAATLIIVNVLVVRFLYSHRALDRRIEGDPIALVEHGRILSGNLTKTLITEDELMVAIRRQGGTDLSDVEKVILESSGTISVLLHHPSTSESNTAELHERLTRIEERLDRLLKA